MRLSSPRQILTYFRLALLVCFLATSAYVVAQSTSAGTVTGTVTDPSGAVIPGAVITITDPSSKLSRTTTSNANGLYIIPDVQPGTYAVTAVKPGFDTDAIAALQVLVGTQATANFKMAVGSESVTISVEAAGADLQTLNASTAEVVDPQLVESLPAINRDASQFAAFMPGVTPGGHVAGTVADQSVFQLDGGDNSSDMDGSMLSYTGSFGGSTTGGFLGSSSSGVMPMPQDSVEEFRVATSGQTADFNNSSGMQASVITKRGRDRWHGSAYEYYLDSNIGANTWDSNFPNACYSNGPATAACPSPNASGSVRSTPPYNYTFSSYTPKASYHFSRFGGAAGGKVPFGHFLGGDTYVFANYEGFRYPLAITYERTVPSFQFLQSGQLTFNGTTYSAAQLQTADPRHIGISPALQAFYNNLLPTANSTNNGSQNAAGNVTYPGTFDSSCSLISSSYCDGVNTIAYRGNVLTPRTSNFFVTRVDHDFGDKWHVNATFHYFKFNYTTANQVDVGGGIAGDKVGVIKALAPRPQQPIYITLGVTTNITNNLTNDFHASFLRNFWQWKNAGDAPQQAGWGGAIEPGGESTSTAVAMLPYNINAQSTRTRIWDGKDTLLRDDLTDLRGGHLLQAGGSFEYKNMYHQRTDNGNAINYSTTYQIGDANGAGNIGLSSALAAISGNTTVNNRILSEYFGFVTDSQVANTYTNSNGTLSLNPPLTPFADNPRVPFYNIYATDTWKIKPSVTLNYGIAYAIEMPPYEKNGNQVMFTDAGGNPFQVQKFLNNRALAAASGNTQANTGNEGINPTLGFALIKNAVGAPGGGKYPYNPFYAGISPHLSVAWSPTMGKYFTAGSTVVRAGYSRIYGRINGDIQGLNPILSPGLVLATQCKYVQTGSCLNNGNYTDTTAFRFGPDGTTAPLFNAPTNLATPVYRPGIDGPGVAIASPVDPTLKPNYVDTFNVSVQRQVNRKIMVEVGYIGRLIRNELITLNPNAVPYMLSQGGQTFAAAYANIEGAFGCTVSASLCAKSATPTVGGNTQPFFEAALGGTGSAYCTGYASCTQAVVTKQAANFRTQKVFNIYSALDNNTNGTTVPGFIFPRTMQGTPLTNAANPAYSTGGQLVTGASVAASSGYSNYNGGYLSFKTTSFHGLTLQENLTYSKALGLAAQTQATSGTVANDSYDIHKNYGVQYYNQKYIFNTFVVWQLPFYKDQNGIIGRFAGGWTLSPVVTAGTGQPLYCTTNNSGQSFGGADGSNFSDQEQCVFTQPYNKSIRTNRGILGGTDPNGVAVGTGYHAGQLAAAVNIFNNPVSVFDGVRPPILGVDYKNSGEGPIPGLGYLNMDLSVKKDLRIFETVNLQFTGVFTNVMNHLDFANPSFSLQSTSNWGVTKSQGNSPRQIQMGVRASF